MNKYQKINYKLAKTKCKYINDNIIKIYQAQKLYNKDKSIKELIDVYNHELKWNKWFDIYNWNWNEDLGYAQWINKKDGHIATEQDVKKIFN